MKRSAVRWFGVFVLLGMAACQSNPDVNVTSAPGITPTGSPTVATIQVADSSGSAGPFTISTGQTLQLTATALDASNNTVTGVSYTWSSSSTATATVSSTGLVTGVAVGGPVNIHAINGAIQSNDASVTVSCAGIPSNVPNPMTVTLNPISPINVNAITSVTAAVSDCNGNPVSDNTSVTFTLNTSSQGNLSTGTSLATTVTAPTAGGAGLASVSYIAGPSGGTVTITATAGTAFASVPVVIQTLPVLGIQFFEAIPQVIGVKGSGQTEVSVVSFSVTDTQGNPFGDGLAVNFEFLSGMNPGGGAQIDPPATATVGGIAQTFLKSGFVAGPTRILAFVDANGNGTFDSGEVYSTTTPLSIGGGVPSAKFFSVTADVHNLAGFAYDGEEANINILLADRFGNVNILEGTSVSFYTEAGGIIRQGITDDQGRTSVPLRTQNPPPIDTDPRQALNPIGNEIFFYNNENANDNDAGIEDVSGVFEDYNFDTNYDVGEHFIDLDGGGYNRLEPNPRDGWVTVLAVVMGEEDFDDVGNGTPGTAGNGLYDVGEPFYDNGGEPFIDENDNDMYDQEEDFDDVDFNGRYTPGEVFYDQGRGEPFFDVNSNGTRDATEPFTDLDGDLVYDAPGDAWYDANSNGGYDGGELTRETNGVAGFQSGGFHDFVYNSGEFFVDFNGDGQWTHGNGQWDSNTAIWVNITDPNQTEKKSQTMVFTGPPDFSLETSRIVIDETHRPPGGGSSYYVDIGECATFDIYVADINNNMLIPGTTITVTSNGAGEFFGPDPVILGDNKGGEPTHLGASICDEDPTSLPGVLNPSFIQVDIKWEPQNADPYTYSMSVGGVVHAAP